MIDPDIPQTQPTPKKRFTRKQLRTFLVIALVILVSAVAGLIVRHYRHPKKTPASNNITFFAYDDAVKSGRINPSDTEVLVVDLVYDPSSQPELSISKLSRYANSVANTPSTAVSDYKLEVFNAKKESVYSDNFAKPVGSVAESFDSKTNAIKGSLISGKSNIPKILPWFGDDTELRITNSAGKIVLTKTLKGIAVTKNTPDFQTIDGQDIR